MTREQVMTVIVRAMNIAGIESRLSDEEVEIILKDYSDSAKISEYAKENVAVCIDAGLIAGKTNSKLDPKGDITIAEVAVVVHRLLKKAKLI